MRRTTNPRQALERLAPLVPGVETSLLSRGARISVPGDGLPPKDKSTLRALAMLADLARHLPARDEIRASVKWHGRVPARGVKGWEVAALEWLTLRERRNGR
jgi:hypothetical protein